jgi:hypothetical protein
VTNVEDPNDGTELSSSDNRVDEIAPAIINADANAEARHGDDESYDGDAWLDISCDWGALAANARRACTISFGIVDENRILRN